MIAAAVILGAPALAFVWLLVFSHYGVSDEQVKEKR
jgi:hypothetical protein